MQWDRARRQPAGIIDVQQAVQPAEGRPKAAASGREQAVGAPATEMKISGKKRKRQFCNHWGMRFGKNAAQARIDISMYQSIWDR